MLITATFDLAGYQMRVRTRCKIASSLVHHITIHQARPAKGLLARDARPSTSSTDRDSQAYLSLNR